MAQEGDTITYTYSDGTSVAEDVSDVAEALVEYCDGAGGSGLYGGSGSGGRVENATIDLSGQDFLYIWVGGQNKGRYNGESASGNGGGSTEISFSNTDASDSSDEPFLVGAGGGVGDGVVDAGAARGGVAQGDGPPKGGRDVPDPDGEGAIDDQNRGVVTGGTTIEGGGSPADTAGEVTLSFQSGLSPPDPPSNLSAEQQ